MSIRNLITQWEFELTELKTALAEIGGKPESFEYNLLATEALRLSMCINQAWASMEVEREQ